MKHTPTPLSHLSDQRLATYLREVIAAAKSRPQMRDEVREILAGELGEAQAELLSGTSLPPETIAALTDVNRDGPARPKSKGCKPQVVS